MPQLIATSARHYFIKRNNSATSIGQPAAGGTLTVYNAGTTTQADTWFDRAGGTNFLNEKPIPLDEQGSCVVWLEAGKLYDWIAKDELGNTIDDTKGITGTGSSVVTPSQWVEFVGTPTFVNSRTFTVTGDQTSIFQAGRRVQVNMSGTTVFATVISSSFSTLTTVTLGFQNQTDIIDASITAVLYGFEPTVNPALAVGSGSIIDLTGYTGADVALGIGRSSIYTVTAATSLLLRAACGDGQRYELVIMGDYVIALASGAQTNLQPNNANTGAGAVTYELNLATQSAPQAAALATNNFSLDAGGSIYLDTATIITRTKGKHVISTGRSAITGTNYQGTVGSFWTDTTTVWSSVGTINWGNAFTGLVQLTRKL
jgi:hypothetical protein